MTKNLTDYWENWWKTKGRNFIGSTGKHRDWKWEIINKYLDEIDHIIDVGCGNLVFFGVLKKKPTDYTGIDTSVNIIELNRVRYPNYTFHVSDAAQKVLVPPKPIVFCLDLLFHIMDDIQFINILTHLCTYSTEWIFIHTWDRPKWKNKITDHVYRYYRPFDDYVSYVESKGFKLIGKHRNPYTVGAMYIFRRERFETLLPKSRLEYN